VALFAVRRSANLRSHINTRRSVCSVCVYAKEMRRRITAELGYAIGLRGAECSVGECVTALGVTNVNIMQVMRG
jgi:hypothetical protein